MDNKLWNIFKVSGHIEDYLRYAMGDEKYDRFLNFADSGMTNEGGDRNDWANSGDRHSA